MFLDAPAEYTDVQTRPDKDFLNQIILFHDKKFARYTKSPIVVFDSPSSYTSIVKPSIIPAPEGLKRAMFRASSRAIGEILR